MKKSLVLAMAMALGVTASAYAANPFSDVPAGHWAYDSISKLAAAGVIEGYGDDTFRGDRLMTRYEMAQIVAKAMAKGANVDKLAAEFADELDALGVRVAALEKKSDNVKITGQIRYRWTEGSPVPGGAARRRGHILRSRLTFNGQVNDTWKYTALLQNQQFFQDNVGNENTDFQRAFVTGRIGGLGVKAGRINETLFEGDTYDTRADALHLSYGDKLKAEAWYGKLTGFNGVDRTGAAVAKGPGEATRYVGARLGYDWDKFGLYAEYDRFTGKGTPAPQLPSRSIWGLVGKAKFGDFGATAQFLHGTMKNNPVNAKKNGWTLGVTYKGANAATPGSWGVGAKYYDMGGLTYIAGCTTWDAYDNFGNWGNAGFKGFKLHGNYAFAKNIVGELQYYDVKGKGNQKAKARTVVADVYFTF